MSRSSQVRARFAGDNHGPELDIEPFADWMERTFRDWTDAEIADALGIHERRVLVIRKRRQHRLRLSTIDAALTAGYGRPDLLGVLYPELYQ